ncbi:MAG: NAD-dependent protein deacetylase [Acidimicrobiia bacterium]|nr:MAG: NAD-dependent protein deacetylase [Acidimicrobiia bacterium]
MTSPVGPAEGLDPFAELIRGAEHILVFTGAGISTASGIPDFRGPEGIWKTRTPIFYQAFMTDADARVEYWQQKAEGAETLEAASPNPSHHAVVELERAEKMELVVTQNVDGLHSEAGTSPDLLVEIHGTAREIECQSCHERSEPGPHLAWFAETGESPMCRCGGYLKTATISFGQQLRAIDVTRAFDAAHHADLVISLGSTLSVTPAADVPLEAAMLGTPYVIVNQGPTEHDGLPVVTLRIEGDLGRVFPPAVELALR